MSLLWQARFFTTVNHLRDLPNTQVPGNCFRRPLERRQIDGDQYPVQTRKNSRSRRKRLAEPSISITFRSAAPTSASTARMKPRSMKSAHCWSICQVTATRKCRVHAKLHWQELLGDYVQRREQLAALVLIVDARRPFTDLDIQMLEWFATNRQADALHPDQIGQTQSQ
jgi:GTP-binding protein